MGKTIIIEIKNNVKKKPVYAGKYDFFYK